VTKLKSFIEKILDSKTKSIKDFIFITFEGFTYQPDSESDVSDIENMQVIGFSKGMDIQEAFENIKNGNSYLKDTSFDEIIGIELKEKKFTYFNLK
jgi:hypothetical protein